MAVSRLVDYERVSFASPLKVMPGDIRARGRRAQLLSIQRYVRHLETGDEIRLSFGAAVATALERAGLTFLLYADGFSKDGINSASRIKLAFAFSWHDKYPYPDTEAYP